MKPNALEILDKIINQDMGFSINGDPKLTAAVKADMRVERNPVIPVTCTTPADEPAISSEDEHPATADLIPVPEFDRNNLWYQTHIATMQEYHIISDKLPRPTRFYRFKCMINKLIRVSTRYQEIFNNSVYSLSSQFVAKIESIQKSIQDICGNINCRLMHIQRRLERQEADADVFQSNTNAKIAELYELVYQTCSESSVWRQRVDDAEKYLRAMEGRVSELERLLQYRTERALELEVKLQTETEKTLELEKFLQAARKQVEKIDTCVHAETEHTAEIEKKFSVETEHIAELEKWMRVEAEHTAGLEKWLQTEGTRIEGIEKWLDATNRRIDSCNELISVSPDITFQSFSQAGEDLIVSFILANMPNMPKRISYLDIGCNHYKNLNNTFRFYQKGYCGVLVEANPHMIDELRQYRPRDIIVNCGVGAESGQSMDFYITNGGGLSSFSREFIDATLAQNPDAKIESVISVEIVSINEIIQKYFAACPTFVSIDIEGNELASLAAMDLEKYRPLIFIVETIAYRKYVTLGIKRQDIVDFMQSKGYEEYAFTGINSIFVDTRVLKKNTNEELV